MIFLQKLCVFLVDLKTSKCPFEIPELPPLKNAFFFPFQVVWHDGVRELPNSWQWLVEHDNGTGSNQKEINVELSRINLGLPLICKVNSSALDAPISKKIHGL